MHTFEVITAAQVLERSLQDAERGQRGYLLTGENAYLAPYKNGVAAIPTQFGRLRQLVNSPEQQRRMPILGHQIDLKMAELARTIAVRDSQGFDAARQIVLTNTGLDVMIAIDDLIDAAIATENGLLTTRTNVAVADERNIANNAIISSAFAATIMAAGIAFALFAFRNILRLGEQQRETAEQFGALINGLTMLRST